MTDSSWLGKGMIAVVVAALGVGCKAAPVGPAAPASGAAPSRPAASTAAAKAEKVAQATASEPVADSAPGAAPARAKPGEGAAEAEIAAPGDGDDDERDYWKGIHFDATNFDEVLDFVDVRYIDPKPDKHMAWVEAANFALLSLEPSEELLPEAFFRNRAGTPDEEGRLDGKSEPFLCKGAALAGVVLHHVPDDATLKAKRPPRKKGRLSDDEVAALRTRSKVRSELYHSTWTQTAFARPEFECVMAHVAVRVKQIHAAAKARKPGDRAPAQVASADKGAAPSPAPVGSAGSAPTDGDPAKPVAAAKNKADADRPRPPPDLNRAWQAAAQGFLYALDPHSSIIPRKAWDESTEKTQDSSFEGIGAVLTQRDDQTIIENPMEGRPAWRAGLRAGDVIQRVDGVDVSGLLLGKVVKMIRGPRATQVKLTITRENDPDPKEYAITRENIEIKNVDGKLLPEYPGIAHVKMTGFIPNSTRDLRAMIDKLAKAAPDGKLRGLVLDLRGNSGGLLKQAIEVADAFMTKGPIVSVRARDKKDEELHNASWSPNDYGFPLVVLVNDGSASASEIVASALQDGGRGLVVGLRTFGKASVQTLYEPALHYDYYIKLTVARYYAPSGYTLQVIGVQPDVEAAPDVDGKIPVGFREENLNNHLVPLQGRTPSPWQPHLAELGSCVAAQGRAETIARREPKPQIHPDFQLLRAADYVGCLALRPTPTTR